MITSDEYREMAKALRKQNFPSAFIYVGAIFFIILSVWIMPLGFIGASLLTVHGILHISAHVAGHMAEWSEKQK